MSHVVLLGDSIFDNATYVPNEPDVISQLHARLPLSWQATLLAVDGAVTGDIAVQLRRLPVDATHLVISAGGNDALKQVDQLSRPTKSILTGLEYLSDLRETFHQGYRVMLDQIRSLGRKVTVCTIYDAIPGLPGSLKTALCLYNDVILREAARHKVSVIDLRLICDQIEDYSTLSPIEPSSRGGEKIASAIADRLMNGG